MNPPESSGTFTPPLNSTSTRTELNQLSPRLSRQWRFSGLGSTGWAPWEPYIRDAKAGLRIICWNARSLLCLDSSKRASKLRLLSEYMRQRFLIVLQEVRGDELRLQRLIDDT
eukprot:3616112-Pyramimonas_sp.AAC.1